MERDLAPGIYFLAGDLLAGLTRTNARLGNGSSTSGGSGVRARAMLLPSLSQELVH